MPKEYTLIGGNGTVVSPLTVTENGTYIAGDSKAFNPVVVSIDTPLPDYTTEQMSFALSGEASADVNAAFVTEGENGVTYAEASIDSEYHPTLKVVLYKGKATAVITPATGTTVTVSGNIEAASGNTYNITGECSITLTKEQQEGD